MRKELKELSKVVCTGCPGSYEDCRRCDVHKLINEILSGARSLFISKYSEKRGK